MPEPKLASSQNLPASRFQTDPEPRSVGQCVGNDGPDLFLPRYQPQFSGCADFAVSKRVPNVWVLPQWAQTPAWSGLARTSSGRLGGLVLAGWS